jgi:hypothetical protein
MIAGHSLGKHMLIVGMMGASNQVLGRFAVEAKVVCFLSNHFYLVFEGFWDW